MGCAKLLVLLSICASFTYASRVLELSDKFLEIRNDVDTPWLVMFYAPWCGHCKRLEPVWAHVAQAIRKTNIRVGKIDCTRFPVINHEFDVMGYPTIKFIRGEEHVTYNGDRVTQDIVDFGVRMSGPPVQEIKRGDSFNTIKGEYSLFFMYVGPWEGNLWNAYYNIATQLQPHGYFFAANPEIAKQHLDLDELPAVFVYKESLHHFYPIESGSDLEEAEHLNTTLLSWINEERFGTFPKVTRGNLNEILHTKKYIVLAIVEENKLLQIPQEMIDFRDMVESVIRTKRDKYHKYFQFGWIGQPDIANSIAMTVLPLPYLLVLNSTTHHHHIPDDEPQHLTPEALDLFLEGIQNESVKIYGGNGVLIRAYRKFFEARTALGDMWKGNPVLTVVLFGLPLSFLSLILYNICCSDIMDAEDDDEEELLHEKKD